MSFYTVPELYRLGREAISASSGESDADAKVLLAKHAHEAEQASMSIHLIMGPADDLLVLGLVQLFTAHGQKVSVNRCSRDNFREDGCTAPEIKQILAEVNQARMVVYVALAEQRMPRWLAWLLGHIENGKQGEIAILPVLNSATEQPVVDSIYAFYPLITHISPEDHSVSSSHVKHCELMRLTEFLAMPNTWNFAR